MLYCPWYADKNCLRLAVHLLLTAQYQPTTESGVALMPGQLITRRPQLVEATGLSDQEIKTALAKLQKYDFITVAATNKFSVVTICKYEQYQRKKSRANQQKTANQQINQQNAKINQQNLFASGSESDSYQHEESTANQQNAKSNQQPNQQGGVIPIYYNKEYKEKESLSVACATDEEREKFFEIFFFRNLIDPANEVERFVNNYEASGWIRKNGRPAVNREALARSWDEEEKNRTLPRRFSGDFLEKWRILYNDARKKMPQYAPYVIHDLRRAVIEADALFLQVSPDLDALIKNYWDSYFVRFFNKFFNGLSIKKRIVQL
jgi:hypothetical protein